VPRKADFECQCFVSGNLFSFSHVCTAERNNILRSDDNFLAEKYTFNMKVNVGYSKRAKIIAPSYKIFQYLVRHCDGDKFSLLYIGPGKIEMIILSVRGISLCAKYAFWPFWWKFITHANVLNLHLILTYLSNNN